MGGFKIGVLLSLGCLVILSGIIVQAQTENKDFAKENTAVRPKIYIYDLPELDFRKPIGDKRQTFYGLDQLFPDLLRESPYITTNPDEADYFYVDAWLYWQPHNCEEVIKAMQKIGPYWDAKRGKDHIFPITVDFGRCDWRCEEMLNSIYLHHFGKVSIPMAAGWPCNLLEKWGGECDHEIMNAMKALRGSVHPRPCHIPNQDIVVPPTPYEYAPNKSYLNEFRTPYIHPELRVNRTDTLFYSGKIDLHAEEEGAQDRPWSDAGYSWGGRQTIYRLHGHLPGYKIYTRHTPESYWKHLSTSVFCLAAAGWGWGGRMKVSVTRGCIPVIVQDGIKVEWEEQLPLKDYSIRVPIWLTHKLPDILDAFIKSGRVEKMQKVLECVWRLHWWRRPYGRAFELTMCELKRRKLGSRIEVDTDTCTIRCGDSKVVNLREGYNNV